MSNTRLALRTLALRYPGVEEGVACEGTKLEKRTLKVGKKAFLFLGPADAMLKLRSSVGEAARLAAKEPDRFKIGANGWATIRFGGEVIPLALLKKWVDESYRLFAGQDLVAELDAAAAPIAEPPPELASARARKRA